VFLTAHEEYALDAFNLEGLDYLLKPIDDARFAACVERARRMLPLHRQEANFERLYGLLGTNDKEENGSLIKRFPLRRGNEFTFIQVGDVDWIEGLGDYAGLHVGGRTHSIREPLTSLEARLDPTQFVRIHRSTRPGGAHCARRSIGQPRCSSNAARRQNAARESNLSPTAG
jgi:two-component system, LytTR family, response regulator